jgi:hypothetical protein
MCPAGSKIEAANENTTIRNKRKVIGILILKAAVAGVRVLSMVDEYSYRSVSGDCKGRSWPKEMKKAAVKATITYVASAAKDGCSYEEAIDV